jgi:hypothetical protein
MKVLRIISSVAFTLLVLVSSSSFSVGLHLCGGHVNDVAFLDDADGCGHENMPPCHRKMMEGCCADETLVHESQGFKADLYAVALAPTLLFPCIQLPVFVADIIPTQPEPQEKFLCYNIPLRSCDRVVAHQVFLI